MQKTLKEKRKNKAYYAHDAEEGGVRRVASIVHANVLTISGKVILQFLGKQHMEEYAAEYCLSHGITSVTLEKVHFGALMRQEHVGGKRQRAPHAATVQKEEIALLFGYRLVYIPRDTLDRAPRYLWSVAKMANGRYVKQMIPWGKRADALSALRKLRQGDA